jgi:hypothetical protein
VGIMLMDIQRSSDYCIKVTNCQSAVGYIVKKHYYDKLIDNIKEGIVKLK